MEISKKYTVTQIQRLTELNAGNEGDMWAGDLC